MCWRAQLEEEASETHLLQMYLSAGLAFLTSDLICEGKIKERHFLLCLCNVCVWFLNFFLKHSSPILSLPLVFLENIVHPVTLGTYCRSPPPRARVRGAVLI